MADFHVNFVLPDGREVSVNAASVPVLDEVVKFDGGADYLVSTRRWYVDTRSPIGRTIMAVAVELREMPTVPGARR